MKIYWEFSDWFLCTTGSSLGSGFVAGFACFNVNYFVFTSIKFL